MKNYSGPCGHLSFYEQLILRRLYEQLTSKEQWSSLDADNLAPWLLSQGSDTFFLPVLSVSLWSCTGVPGKPFFKGDLRHKHNTIK